MFEVVSAVLAVLLLLALRRLWAHRRAAELLHVAIERNRPLLREDLPGAAGVHWEQLASDVNDLVEDVRRLQKLRTGQLAQLEATLGSLQEAVLIVDSENTILLANKALQAIFPDAKNILNQRLERVLHSAAFLKYVSAVRESASAQPVREIEFAEGKKTVWVEVTGTIIPPLDAQRSPWALFVLHDITNLKKLEMVRKEFVANVSHELRTPLSVIKGYVETLVDGHTEMPLEDRERFLRTIQRHTERLNSLLEDLLTLSRLESINPGLRRETVNFSELLSAVMDDFRARPAAEGFHLESRVDAAIGPLLIDPLKITQVLENLIENALKYTPKGSHISVEARLGEKQVEVSVSDDGPGIPEADLPHIFERFYRVDKGRSREKGGTGLGLSIVKHIVQLHQGRVWVESRLGKGTAFFFTLPQRATAEVKSN
ncbi:histidine kinase [Opitutaceae bacterium EW11]|nr:histidine kinase [Opitutaceae bacterium EW11]